MVPSEGFEPPTGGLEVHCPTFHIIHNISLEPIAAGSNVYYCFFGFIFQHPRRCQQLDDSSTPAHTYIRKKGGGCEVDAFLYVWEECSAMESRARAVNRL